MSLQQGSRLGRYEVVSPLGAGGMGEVWRARDTRLGREVALKILSSAFVTDPERLVRFEREAKVLASLNHPNIGGIHGLEDQEGVTALVLELIEGPTLADRIARGALPLLEALAIARQIATALEAAHEQGVIHRDLKPANIKIRPDGTVKVLDFGLAKALQPRLATGGADPSLSPTLALDAAATQPGIIVGTPAYMAPEQISGRTVDKRADLWSFGCVLYEMLTGRRAFAGRDVADTLASVVRSEPDWSALPADTPPGTRRLLHRALQKDPAERVRDAGDARLDLAAASDPTIAAVAPRHAPRRWWPVAVTALAVAALTSGIFSAMSASRAGGERSRVEWCGERLGGPDIALGPRVSPNGQMLAFEAVVDQTTQVGIMLLGSGQWTILTRDRSGGPVAELAWAPDGSSVYFDRVIDKPGGVFRVPALGGEPRLVLEHAMTPQPLPDGSLIVVRLNEKEERQLFRFLPESGALAPLNGIVATTVIEPAIRTSPDGRRVVFYGRPVEEKADRDRLHSLDLESGRVHVIEAQPFRDSWTLPLAITRDGEELLIDAVSGDLHRIVAAPLSGQGVPRSLFDLTSRAQGLDAGDDGVVYASLLDQPVEILAFDPAAPEPRRTSISNMSGGAEIRVLPLPDGRVAITTRTAGRGRVMAVLPDGTVSPLFETREETNGPLALVGPETVALLLGSAPQQVLALASITHGRVERRLDSIDASAILSVAGSPDGKTLYYAESGLVSAMDLESGESTVLHAGEAVAPDPGGAYVVVAVAERGGRRLVKVSVPDGVIEAIPIQSELAIVESPLAPNAVSRDGRIAVHVALKESWFWWTGILDPRTGRIESPWREIEPAAAGHSGDKWGGWADDGRLILSAVPTRSALWRFVREPAARSDRS